MKNRPTISSINLLSAGVFSAVFAIVILALVPKTYTWTQWAGAGFALTAVICFADVLERSIKREK